MASGTRPAGDEDSVPRTAVCEATRSGRKEQPDEDRVPGAAGSHPSMRARKRREHLSSYRALCYDTRHYDNYAILQWYELILQDILHHVCAPHPGAPRRPTPSPTWRPRRGETAPVCWRRGSAARRPRRTAGLFTPMRLDFGGLASNRCSCSRVGIPRSIGNSPEFQTQILS